MNYEETLDMNRTQFKDVEMASELHKCLKTLWKSLSEWTKMVDEWQSVPFSEIDTEIISDQCEEYYKRVTKISKKLP